MIVGGAAFLWLVLQHVLPKGFRRARNFCFLHPNSKRLITLLHLVLKVSIPALQNWIKPRPAWACPGCGILHTLTPEADLHKRSGLRQIAYAWGTARIETFEATSELIGADKFVGLHLDQLLGAVCEGVNNTFVASATDVQLKKNLDDAASRHFSHVPRSTLERFESHVKARTQ